MINRIVKKLLGFEWRIRLYLVVVTFLINCAGKESNQKPNILFIFTDDQMQNSIHALGNSVIRTPHLDSLVSAGTFFSNAYNMGAWGGAVCVSSRAMMMSGRSLWRARILSEDWKAGDSLQHTWASSMERAGYATYMTGKWHIDAEATEVFQIAKNVRPGMPRDLFDFTAVGKMASDPEFDEWDTLLPVGYNRPRNEDDTSWSSYDTTFGGYWEGGKHWTEVVGDDAIEFINNAEEDDSPFFMYIAFNAPHDPRQAPREFFDLYPLEKISLPPNWMPEYPYKDAIGNGRDLRDEALAPFPRTEHAVKTHIREYYASITHLDEQIGKILATLKRSGKAENTYIFFTSDHGLALGSHGLMGKQSLFEHSTKPPLIVAGPRVQVQNNISAPVYIQDIMATALDIAGSDDLRYLEFHSLLPLATGETNKTAYDAIYGAYMNYQRSIRKDGFKLILFPQIRKILLFDLARDPYEMNDLGNDEKHRARIQSLFQQLMVMQSQLDDPLDLSQWYSELMSQ